MKLGDLTTTDKLQLTLSSVGRDFNIGHQGNPDPALYDLSFNDGTIVFMANTFDNNKGWWTHTTNSNDYANTDLNAWLNSEILNTFSEKDLVKEVKIPYRPGSGQSNGVSSGANGLPVKLYLLGVYEVGGVASGSNVPVDGTVLDYFAGISSNAASPKRVAYRFNGQIAPNKGLRTPWSNHGTGRITMWVNEDNGLLTGSPGMSSAVFVQPALVLPQDLKVKQLPTGQYILDLSKYLVSFSGLTYTHNGLDWASLGKSPSALTEQDFDEQPVNPEKLTAEELNKLGSPIDILTLSDSVPVVSLKPGPQIVVPLSSMDLSLARTIEQITAQDTGTVYRLLSLDNGLTWNTLTDGTISPVNLTGSKPQDKEIIKTEGLTTTDISNITESTWQSLFSASPVKQLAFLTLLEGEAYTRSISVLQDRYGHYRVLKKSEYVVNQHINSTDITFNRAVTTEAQILYQSGGTPAQAVEGAIANYNDTMTEKSDELNKLNMQNEADIAFLEMMTGV
jgi:hypothetical protein